MKETNDFFFSHIIDPHKAVSGIFSNKLCRPEERRMLYSKWWGGGVGAGGSMQLIILSLLGRAVHEKEIKDKDLPRER